MFDVAVIGAGMAGLVCAQQLVQAGYSVVVVEKSRGLGGRVATRRLYGTCADHGLCYLKPKQQLLQQLVQVLCHRHLLQVWTDTYELEPNSQQLKPASQSPRYVAPTGMSAIAKFLAAGLDVRLNQRVQVVNPATDNFWHLTSELTNSDAVAEELKALAVVVAIPAPQALMLLEPLAETGLPAEFLDNLRLVEFDPCLSVIAGYPAQSQPAPDWKAITVLDDPDLGWIGLDSSKRMQTGQPPVFVVQSSAGFAKRYLDSEDLQAAGRHLLHRAAKTLLPWLDNPEWMQVHRWRYAFPRRPWHQACLTAETPLPLVCCGDWCGGYQVDSAVQSGFAAAEQINGQLRQLSLPRANYLDSLAREV